MNTISISSLPLECISMVGPYLNRSDLINCVTLNKQWYLTFTPHLWKHVQIRCHQEPRHAYKSPITQDKRANWFRRLKRSIKAGGLEKNGRYVQTFSCGYFEAVKLLATQGMSCTGIRKLKLGSYPDPDSPPVNSRSFASLRPLNLSPLQSVFRRSAGLKKLKLAGRMLDEENGGIEWVLGFIPMSIESLDLRMWDPIKGTREYPRDLQSKKELSGDGTGCDDSEEWAAPVETQFPHLKYLSFYEYAIDANKKTMRHILSNSTNLEVILVQDSYQPIRLGLLSRLLSRHCPRVQHLYVENWTDCIDAELAELLNASKAGWRTLELPTTWSSSNEDEFGPLSTAALVKNAPTLENVRLDSFQKLSLVAAKEIWRSAPNLQLLDARIDEHGQC